MSLYVKFIIMLDQPPELSDEEMRANEMANVPRSLANTNRKVRNFLWVMPGILSFFLIGACNMTYPLITNPSIVKLGFQLADYYYIFFIILGVCFVILVAHMDYKVAKRDPMSFVHHGRSKRTHIYIFFASQIFLIPAVMMIIGIALSFVAMIVSGFAK